MGCWKKSLSILRKLFNRNKTPNRVIGMGTLGIANDCRGQLSLLLDSWDSNLRAGLEIRPVFAKLRFWVCRTLEFFAWVFEKNQGFLKKSYVNWSRICIEFSQQILDFHRNIQLFFFKNNFKIIFAHIQIFCLWNFVESLSFTLELLSFSLEFWVFFFLSFFQNVKFLSLA